MWNTLLAQNESEADVKFEEYINAKTPRDGFTAVHLAILEKNLNLLKRLVNLGANMQIKASHRVSALHLAATLKAPSSVGIVCFLALKYPSLLMEKDSVG